MIYFIVGFDAEGQLCYFMSSRQYHQIQSSWIDAHTSLYSSLVRLQLYMVGGFPNNPEIRLIVDEKQ